MITVGLVVTLNAKPGREADVAAFLRDAQVLVEAEEQTVSWIAVRRGPSSFAIIDAFSDESGRQAHLSGAVAVALAERAGELLAGPPQVEPVDVLAAKLG